MKEKIIEVLKENESGMDAIELTRHLFENDTLEDLKEVQEFLYELEEEGLIMLSKKHRYRISDLLKGEVDLHLKGNAHVKVEGREEDIFIPKPYMNNASHKDIVLVKITDEALNEGKIVKIVDKSLGNTKGLVKEENGIIKIIPYNQDIEYKLKIEFDKNAPYVDGQIVNLKYIEDLSNSTLLVYATDVITHINAPDKDIRLIASEFDIILDFTQEVLNEARNMPQKLSNEEIEKELSNGRVDFRNEIIFTIDGIDTKDIDDAVTIKILPNGNYELGVHIADVSYYVKEGSGLWNEASNRGNSNYLGNTVIPMLPPELSNGICSLNPNVDRFTKSAIMEINHKGEIVNSKIVNGIINSRKKMDYDRVQAILEGNTVEGYDVLDYILKENETFEEIIYQNCLSEDEAYQYNERKEYKAGDVIKIPCDKILKNMYTLSKILKNMKNRRGKIDFESDEIKFKYDEDNNPVDVELRVQRDAEMLIEDFMIAANEAVASEIFAMNLPFVYRVHNMPSPKKIEDFINYLSLQGITYNGKIDYNNITSKDIQQLHEYLSDQEKFSIYNKKLLRSMMKAIYDINNTGHFGIGSSCYTHFTSPIRRMSDLLVHKCIEYYILLKEFNKEFLKKWESYLIVLCEHISDTERNSEKCEYAVDDMLSAKYMMNHIGEEYDAMIDSCMKDGFFVITSKHISGRVDLMDAGEKLMYDPDIDGYRGRKNRVIYSAGDKVRVECLYANPDTREIDFKLVRKL